MKKKLTFSEWLALRHVVILKDFDESKVPELWARFGIKAMAVYGNTIYIQNMDAISEVQRTHLVLHELRHIEHQRESGWMVYLPRYAGSAKYRCQDEVSAYTVSMEHMYLRGKDISGYPAYIANLMRRDYYIGWWRARWVKARMLENMDRIKRGKIHHVDDLIAQWERV